MMTTPLSKFLMCRKRMQRFVIALMLCCAGYTDIHVRSSLTPGSVVMASESGIPNAARKPSAAVYQTIQVNSLKALVANPDTAPVKSPVIFVRSEGEALDRLWRRGQLPSNSRIRVTIPINRFYSNFVKDAIDASGFLIPSHPKTQKMLEKYVLPAFATLKISAGDVDSDTGNKCNEVDKILVNGKVVSGLPGNQGSLQGLDNDWKTTRFNVPIEYLKLPIDAGTTVNQEIDIEVNTKLCDRPSWEVEVDWVALEIPTNIRPVVLVHGFTGTSTSMRNLQNFLAADGIPNVSVEMDKATDTLVKDAARMYSNFVTNDYGISILPQVSEKFGSDFDIWAHSKGGLISRSLLRYYPGIRKSVRALVTFSSPHHGIGGTHLSDDRVFAALMEANCASAAANYVRCVVTAQQMRHIWVANRFTYKKLRFGEGEASNVYVPGEFWREDGIRYFSLAGGKAFDALIDAGHTGAFPWQYNPNRENKTFDGTYPDQSYVNAYYPDVGHAVEDPAIHGYIPAYRCAIGFVEPNLAFAGDCENFKPESRNRLSGSKFLATTAQLQPASIQASGPLFSR